jgi:hypothetical protein
MKQVDKVFPTLKELITLMEQKCKDLETLKPSINIANRKETQGGKQQQKSAWGITTFVAMTENKCVLSHIVCLNVQRFHSRYSSDLGFRNTNFALIISGRVIQLEYVDADVVIVGRCITPCYLNSMIQMHPNNTVRDGLVHICQMLNLYRHHTAP